MTEKDELLITADRGVTFGLRELWSYRELAYFLLMREIKAEHRQMALGPLWIVIGPVISMLLYTLIFGVVAGLPSDELPYPVFNLAALILWTFFASASEAAGSSLLKHRQLIRKVYFPRLVLPLVAVLGKTIDFCVGFLLFLLLLGLYGITPEPTILLTPIFLLFGAVTACAVGVWLASWVVHYHDAAKLLAYGLAAWMYASPVVYPASMVPEPWRTLYRTNPMAVVIDGFRWAALGTPAPPLDTACAAVAIVLLLLAGGLLHFRRTERVIVDVA